jgi:hypothetical protein
MLTCALLVYLPLSAVPESLQIAEGLQAVRELRHGHALVEADLMEDDRVPPTGPELDQEQKEDRRRLIAALSERMPALGERMAAKLQPEEIELVERAKAELRPVTPETCETARRRVRAQRPKDFGGDDDPITDTRKMTCELPAVAAALFAFFGILSALVLRGGASLRVLSIAVRSSRGARAGRIRCAWRALVSAVPFVVLYGLPWALALEDRLALAAVALGVAVALHLGLVVVALRNPARGWQDRIAGTRLVPR